MIFVNLILKLIDVFKIYINLTFNWIKKINTKLILIELKILLTGSALTNINKDEYVTVEEIREILLTNFASEYN